MVQTSDFHTLGISSDVLIGRDRLGDVLHDARLSLTSLILDNSVLTIQGSIDRRIVGRLNTGRFSFVMTCTETSGFRFEDSEGTEEVIIERVETTSDLITVVGSVPASLWIVSNAISFRVVVADAPHSILRWFRWHQFSD